MQCKRTWKDAACEVALNKIEKEYKESYPFFYVNVFLEGNSGFPWGVFGAGCGNPINMESCGTKGHFRSTFMKWLEENEVKRG